MRETAQSALLRVKTSPNKPNKINTSDHQRKTRAKNTYRDMSGLKLTYFNARARAEVSRMMLNYTGKKFTDVRVEFADWPKMKPTTALGSLPMLETDGKETLVQSMSIARYIARETGLQGSDSIHQARVDMITQTVEELVTKKAFVFLEQDPKKKAELAKEAQEVIAPRVLAFLEKTIGNNSSKSGFMVGNSLTMADFMAWHVLDYILVDAPNFLDSYPKMKANRDKIGALPKFAEYLKNRPKTPM